VRRFLSNYFDHVLYLNNVIFAVLDVSSLPLQKCQTAMEDFFLH